LKSFEKYFENTILFCILEILHWSILFCYVPSTLCTLYSILILIFKIYYQSLLHSTGMGVRARGLGGLQLPELDKTAKSLFFGQTLISSTGKNEKSRIY